MLSAGVLIGLASPFAAMGHAVAAGALARPIAATGTGKGILVLGSSGQMLSLYARTGPGRYALADQRVLPDDFAPVALRTIDAAHETAHVFGADLHITQSGIPIFERAVTHTPAIFAVSTGGGRIALSRRRFPVGTGVAIDGWQGTTRVVLSSRQSGVDGRLCRVGEDYGLTPERAEPTSRFACLATGGMWRAGDGGQVSAELLTAAGPWHAWHARPGRVRSLAAAGHGAVVVWTDRDGGAYATSLPSGRTRQVPAGAVATGGSVAGAAVPDGATLDLIEMGA